MIRFFVSIRLPALLLGAVILLPTCAKSPTGPVVRTGTSPAVDSSPVWSPDGRLIAFHRRVSSSAGPPGVYVVSSAGGPIRYVAPGDFFWPINLRFSPDGTRLVCVYNLQLYIVDLPTATHWNLFYATNGANYPDWSPDGRYVLYSRVFFNSDSWPIDSAGIHYLDLTTGQDHVVWAEEGSSLYAGRYTLWSRDGSEFAFLETRVDGHNLAMVNRDGSGYRVLAASPSHTLYNYLYWFFRPSRGMDGLVFAGRGGPYYVNRIGGVVHRFDNVVDVHQAFSPDGEWLVDTGVDPVDSVSVLFVLRIDDVTRASKRQLTFWDPPDSLPLAAPISSPLHSFISDVPTHK